jgi:hypothetical protein
MKCKATLVYITGEKASQCCHGQAPEPLFWARATSSVGLTRDTYGDCTGQPFGLTEKSLSCRWTTTPITVTVSGRVRIKHFFGNQSAQCRISVIPRVVASELVERT